MLKLFKNTKTGNFELSDPETTVLVPFQFTQDTPAMEWLVVHNKNTKIINVQVYIDNLLAEYDRIELVDDNSLIIYHSIPVSGFANIAAYTKDIYQ